jgi:glycosyltransferase domain-containing protein
MLNELTIVIPTYNRKLVLTRAMHYYTKWDCSFIICDSSDVIPVSYQSDRVDHIHCPGMFFSEKISFALNKVTTPFACLCADDDFLAQSGVTTAISFLKSNQQYVSAQGVYAQFFQSGSVITPVSLYSTMQGLHFDSDNIRERLVASAKTGMHQLYAVHRTEVLAKTFSACRHMQPPSFAEYSSNLFGLFYGKHIMLPVFWMARDAARYTEYNTNKNNANTILLKHQLGDYLLSPPGQQYKENFVKYFTEASGESEGNAGSLFDQIFFDIYLKPRPTTAHRQSAEEASPESSRQYLNARSVLKKITTQKFRQGVRNIIKKLTPGIIHEYRNRRLFPFPYSDKPEFVNDWKMIAKSIRNFRELQKYAV